jgi:hypothetical protein
MTLESNTNRAVLITLRGERKGKHSESHHYSCTRMVPECFGLDVDFAQLVKLFGDFGQYGSPEGRYSPPRIA